MRRFLLIPAGGIVALVVAYAVLDDAMRARLFEYDHIVLKALACAGTLAAALHFSRRDFLFYAWAAQAASYGTLFTRDVLTRLGHLGQFGQHLCVIFANAIGVLGMWLFARAYHASGLEFAGTPTARRLGIAAGILVALGISAHPLYTSYLEWQQGNPDGVTYLVSSAGDMLSLSLIAPVMLTALSLRGGRLAWPWTLLVASGIGWLTFDVIATIEVAAGAATLEMALLRECTRVIGCLCAASAGLAQRSVTSA